MEARNLTDLARNELVSIFLKVLEYYEVRIQILLLLLGIISSRD
jgi:hypothetical protein